MGVLSTRNVISLRDLVRSFRKGDLLIFGYTHSGYRDLFFELAREGTPPNIDIFMLTLRFGKQSFIPLHKLCEELQMRFMIPQPIPEFSTKVAERKIHVTPLTLFQVASFLEEVVEQRRTILFCEVAPPDEDGYCSMGFSAPYPPTIFNKCAMVVGIINPKMPKTFGDTMVKTSSIHYFLDFSIESLPFFDQPRVSEATRRVGKLASDLVEDGSTIEVGIGGVADSVIASLEGKANLAVHTGLLSQGFLSLIKKGVVAGKIVANVVGAYDQSFYQFVDNNPMIEIRNMSYVHNINVIASKPKFTAINTAIAVDLLGQATAESVNARQIAGAGGLPDFVRGSRLSKGGKSILVLESTHKERSRIIPALERGAITTISMYDADYVVTEYGVASLRGKSKEERAKELISVAHPEHQRWLTEEAKKLNLI